MINILVAGDFVPCLRIAKQIDTGDYSFLNQIKTVVNTADYSIVNLESPIVEHDAKPIEKAGPNLRCSSKAMDSLANIGFDCITLANNHFLDYGETGVDDTLEACRSFNVDWVGGGKNINLASQTLYKEIEGKNFAFINCCEHEFSIATETSGGANPLNPISQYYAIKEAKSKADYVVVIVHGGYEMYQLPSPRMVETYRFLVDSGADAVVNHHQHCFSGYEVYKGSPIIYGLGNFCFDSPRRNSIWNEGYMVMLEYDDDIRFQIVPYRQCDEKPCVEILGKDAYDDKLKQLNNIIADKEMLQTEAEKLYRTHRMLFQGILEPIRSKYILSCVEKGLIPSLISKKRKLQAENYICCESLRDGFIDFLMNQR